MKPFRTALLARIHSFHSSLRERAEDRPLSNHNSGEAVFSAYYGGGVNSLKQHPAPHHRPRGRPSPALLPADTDARQARQTVRLAN